jgi:hypothetical protein
MTKTYSNPRMTATIKNWPMGGIKRGTAVFEIETSERGERAHRTTFLPLKPPTAPKLLTYAQKMRIVDGDDGRTYIAALTAFGHITIKRSDMKFDEESVFERDERYPALRALFA